MGTQKRVCDIPIPEKKNTHPLSCCYIQQFLVPPSKKGSKKEFFKTTAEEEEEPKRIVFYSSFFFGGERGKCGPPTRSLAKMGLLGNNAPFSVSFHFYVLVQKSKQKYSKNFIIFCRELKRDEEIKFSKFFFHALF